MFFSFLHKKKTTNVVGYFLTLSHSVILMWRKRYKYLSGYRPYLGLCFRVSVFILSVYYRRHLIIALDKVLFFQPKSIYIFLIS